LQFIPAGSFTPDLARQGTVLCGNMQHPNTLCYAKSRMKEPISQGHRPSPKPQPGHCD